MERQATIAAIEDGVRRLGQALPADGSERLATLLAELERWNRRINLTAIRDPAAMVSGHVLDSLAVRPFVRGPMVVDIGTGAGFPGLPLAIAEPGLEFELVDSSGRKIAFVRHIIHELGVSNAHAEQARMERLVAGAREVRLRTARFDTVLARALGTVSYLVETAGHLVADRGVMLAMKGQYPHDELEQLAQMDRSQLNRSQLKSRWAFDVTALTVPGLEAHARHVVRLRPAADAGP